MLTHPNSNEFSSWTLGNTNHNHGNVNGNNTNNDVVITSVMVIAFSATTASRLIAIFALMLVFEYVCCIARCYLQCSLVLIMYVFATSVDGVFVIVVTTVRILVCVGAPDFQCIFVLYIWQYQSQSWQCHDNNIENGVAFAFVMVLAIIVAVAPASGRGLDVDTGMLPGHGAMVVLLLLLISFSLLLVLFVL